MPESPTTGRFPASSAATAALHAQGHPGSVWLTGQQPSRELRKERYVSESITHPGKMLPTIARYAINTYTQPGDVVLDPMAGIGTTVIEAMHLARHGIGVEYEDRWAALAAVNIALAERQAAPGTGTGTGTGTGQVYTGDSRHLASLLPHRIRGRVALVVTSPPYGASTHGQVRTPGTQGGKVRKIHHRYVLVPRASFFQQKNVRDAIATGDPQWIPQHEDVIILSAPLNTRLGSTRNGLSPAVAHTNHRLDASTPNSVDRRAHPAHPANANRGGSATHTRSQPNREAERKSDPCPPYSRPTPRSVRPDTATYRWPTDANTSRPQASSSSTVGRR